MVLEVYGADHPEGGVPAPTVIDDFNPTSNGLAHGITGHPTLTVVEFSFKRRPERLSHRVIEAHTSTPHRLGNVQVAAHLPELLACELGSTVSVEHQPNRNITAEVYVLSGGPVRLGMYLERYPSPSPAPSGNGRRGLHISKASLHQCAGR